MEPDNSELEERLKAAEELAKQVLADRAAVCLLGPMAFSSSVMLAQAFLNPQAKEEARAGAMVGEGAKVMEPGGKWREPGE